MTVEMVNGHIPSRELVGKTLLEACVLIMGRVVLSSGVISEFKIDFDYLFKDEWRFKQICRWAKEYLDREGGEFDAYAGVITGGARLAKMMSSLGGKGYVSLLGLKENGETKAYLHGEIEEGKRYWIIEDVITFGTNTKKVIEKIKEKKGEIAGILCIHTYGLTDEINGHKVHSLTTFENWRKFLSEGGNTKLIDESYARLQEATPKFST